MVGVRLLLPSFLFRFFFPLVTPWRLRYKRNAMGKLQTLVEAQKGQRTISVNTTQSCPQLVSGLARLEISGSWCMPVP